MATERKLEVEQEAKQVRPAEGSRSVLYLLNSLIVLLVLAVSYLVYTHFISSAKNEIPIDQNQAARVIQLDVLNGCGIPKSTAHLTDILRQRGFDVVEVKNYLSFAIPQTIIIDRTGNRTAARRVAAALGVDENNIVQQFNPDYFVDVSVVVGRDYSELKPSKIIISKEKD
jgi:LytR cell envelope-related transcriptional attenuator